MNKIGVPSSNVQLAVSRYMKNSDISPSQAEAALGLKICHFVPEDALVVKAAVNCGVPVVTEAPRCSFAKAIASLAAALPHSGPPPDEDGPVREETIPTALMGTLRTFLKMSVRECTLTPS
jgi:MinD-like ATPase involved in chromosome partitioning or flagellar assembly